jgi:hypothetical protein
MSDLDITISFAKLFPTAIATSARDNESMSWTPLPVTAT